MTNSLCFWWFPCVYLFLTELSHQRYSQTACNYSSISLSNHVMTQGISVNFLIMKSLTMLFTGGEKMHFIWMLTSTMDQLLKQTIQTSLRPFAIFLGT